MRALLDQVDLFLLNLTLGISLCKYTFLMSLADQKLRI